MHNTYVGWDKILSTNLSKAIFNVWEMVEYLLCNKGVDL